MPLPTGSVPLPVAGTLVQCVLILSATRTATATLGLDAPKPAALSLPPTLSDQEAYNQSQQYRRKQGQG